MTAVPSAESAFAEAGFGRGRVPGQTAAARSHTRTVRSRLPVMATTRPVAQGRGRQGLHPVSVPDEGITNRSTGGKVLTSSNARFCGRSEAEISRLIKYLAR